jgi:FAD binding domain
MSSPPVAAPDDLDRRLAALRHRVDGEVLVPGDDGFGEAALAWNRAATHRPVAIVVAADVGDVIAAVTFAAELGVGLGVQATGHGVAASVDGVLLVTSRMAEVEIDAEARTAWVGAGCQWAPVLAAAQRHGLAPLVGSSTAIGAVGYTLGGGLGWLARRFGPACDAVRSFEVVTPGGELVQACRDEHPELFRALRGGGGGALGVVTEMEIELFPVTTVYGGNLVYPPDAAAEVVARWSAWAADAPDDLTSSVVLVDGPGTLPAVLVRGCWCGDLDAGRALLDTWRTTMPPLVDQWRELPFADVASISAHPLAPVPAVITGEWLTDPIPGAGLPPEVGATLAGATFTGDPSSVRYVEIRHAGGAVAAGDRQRSSLGNRDRQFHLQLVGVPASAATAATGDLQAALMAALRRHLSGRTYLNGLGGPARCAAAATAIDTADLAAIAAVRAAVDPDDVLRFGVDHRAAGPPRKSCD